MQLSEAQSSELPIQFIQSKRERETEKWQPVRKEYRKAMSYFASFWFVTYRRKTGEQNTRIVSVPN